MAKRKHRGNEFAASVDRDIAIGLLGRTHRRLQLLSGASSMLGGLFMVLLLLVWTGRLSTPSPVRLGALAVAAAACFLNAFMYRRSMARQADHFAGRELPDQVLRAGTDGLDVWSRAGCEPVHLAWPGLMVRVVDRQGSVFIRFSPQEPFNAEQLKATGLAPEVAENAAARNYLQISAAILDVSLDELVEGLDTASGGRVCFEGREPATGSGAQGMP